MRALSAAAQAFLASLREARKFKRAQLGAYLSFLTLSLAYLPCYASYCAIAMQMRRLACASLQHAAVSTRVYSRTSAISLCVSADKKGCCAWLRSLSAVGRRAAILPPQKQERWTLGPCRALAIPSSSTCHVDLVLKAPAHDLADDLRAWNAAAIPSSLRRTARTGPIRPAFLGCSVHELGEGWLQLLQLDSASPLPQCLRCFSHPRCSEIGACDAQGPLSRVWHLRLRHSLERGVLHAFSSPQSMPMCLKTPTRSSNL